MNEISAVPLLGLPPFPWPPERTLETYPHERAEAVREAARQISMVVFDFDGVFTDNAVYVSQDGVESVRSNRWEGFGLDKLRARSLRLLVISTEKNLVVKFRCQKLKLDCVQNVSDKLSELRLQAGGTPLEQIAFVGNDVNDAECLAHVGFPITVADAHPAVERQGLYQTVRPGGYGAVREICDLIDALRR